MWLFSLFHAENFHIIYGGDFLITEVSKIREREVVNVCNGKNLGYICDILIDTDCGKIVAIFVSENVFGFGGKNSKRIPWEKITCIGEDTILVSIEDGGGCGCACDGDSKRPKKRSGWLF